MRSMFSSYSIILQIAEEVVYVAGLPPAGNAFKKDCQVSVLPYSIQVELAVEVL